MARRLVLCRKCAEVYPKKNRRCPKCNKKYKKPIHMRWWFILAYLTSFFFFAMSSIRTYGLPPVVGETLAKALPSEVMEMLADYLPAMQGSEIPETTDELRSMAAAAVTATPTASPKAAAIPEPTATSKPTSTAKPTATAKSTATAKPTATVRPTNTPRPTSTPKPTATSTDWVHWTALPAPTNTPKSASGLVNGMRPEFKKAMDEYEAFFDKYVEYMKKISSPSFNPMLLLDYAKMTAQYAEMLAALEAWDEEEMNNTELKYYLDVTNRINQKLLDIAQ